MTKNRRTLIFLVIFMIFGKLYVAEDFGENNYLNSIQSDKKFTVLKFNGVVISESPVYNVKLDTISPKQGSIEYSL